MVPLVLGCSYANICPSGHFFWISYLFSVKKGWTTMTDSWALLAIGHVSCARRRRSYLRCSAFMFVQEKKIETSHQSWHFPHNQIFIFIYIYILKQLWYIWWKRLCLISTSLQRLQPLSPVILVQLAVLPARLWYFVQMQTHLANFQVKE